MKKNFAKSLASVLSMALVVASVAPVTASAATAPNLEKRYTNVYDGKVYSYTATNVKGYTVKWSVTGEGADYAELTNATGSKTILAVDANDATEAKNAELTVKAKFYKSGKYVSSRLDNVVIKVSATDVAINAVEGLDAVAPGTTIDFNRTLAPANSTSKTYWKVTNAAGEVVAADVANIDAKGVFKATKAGEYVVVAEAKNSSTGTLLADDHIAVNVVNAVSNVVAVDGKTVEVYFNGAINKDTLKASNVDVITVVPGTNATAPGVITQTLDSTGTKLTLKAATTFNGAYTIKVPFETVKGTDGSYVKAVNYNVSVSDTTAPLLVSAVASVKSTADKTTTVKLTFSEDVTAIDNVKIAGANYTPVVAGNTVTVNAALDSTKAFDVTAVNVQDARGNVKDVQSVALTVQVDSAAPSVVGYEVTGENTVKLTLDKDVTLFDVIGNVGSFTSDIASVTGSGKEFIVTFNSSYLFKSANTETATLKIAKETLVDSLGNKNANDITYQVSLVKDVAGPTVATKEDTLTNGKVTGFTLTFNENVNTIDTSKVTVVNTKGEILPYASVVATTNVNGTNAKKVDFTFVPGLADSTYTFDLAEGFVKDTSLATNKSAVYSTTATVATTAAPTATTFTISGASILANVITVDFGTKVKATGTGSALSNGAYQINGTTLPTGTEIKFVVNGGVVDQTKVTIKLPEGFVVTSDAKAIFRVSGVQTLESKVSNAFIKELSIVDNTAPVATSFVATDLNKLSVTYSESLVAFTTADVTDEIQLYDSNNALVVITSATVGVDGKLVITTTAADGATKVVKLTTVAGVVNGDIKDAAGLTQKAATVNK